jgi:hypothetical protein
MREAFFLKILSLNAGNLFTADDVEGPKNLAVIARNARIILIRVHSR